MHRPFVFLVLSFLAGNLLFASTPSRISPNIFQDDLTKLDCEMAQLSQLEQWVNETNLTQSQLLQADNPLVQCVLQGGDLTPTLFANSTPQKEWLMGIPGFLWGFCCSFIGPILVYLSIDDPVAKKKEGIQAIIGCAVGSIVWLGLYIWLIVSASYY